MITQLTAQPVARHHLPVRRTAQVLPAAAGLLYAGVQLEGGILAAVYRGISTVPTDRLNFPFSGELATATSLVWGTTQALFVLTLLAFARTDAFGPSRSGRIGARLAVAGGMVFTAAHAVSAIFRNANVSDVAGTTAIALFLIGSLCIAGGFILAGIAVRRSGVWTSWRRSAPLVVGVWTVCLVPLQLTPLLPVAVTVYALVIAAFSVALLCEDPR